MDKRPYRVLEAVAHGLRFVIEWRGGLTFNVYAGRPHHPSQEVHVFTYDGVIGGFEHAREIACEWWQHDGGREDTLTVIEHEHPELLEED